MKCRGNNNRCLEHISQYNNAVECHAMQSGFETHTFSPISVMSPVARHAHVYEVSIWEQHDIAVSNATPLNLEEQLQHEISHPSGPCIITRNSSNAAKRLLASAPGQGQRTGGERREVRQQSTAPKNPLVGGLAVAAGQDDVVPQRAVQDPCVLAGVRHGSSQQGIALQDAWRSWQV